MSKVTLKLLQSYEGNVTKAMATVIEARRAYQTTLELVTRPVEGFAAYDLTRVRDLVHADFLRAVEIFRENDRLFRECRRQAGQRRRAVTPKQLAMLHVASRQLFLYDELYRDALMNFGGVESADELDQHGFEWVLAYFEGLGFHARRDNARKAPTFGRRANMASPAQVELIRTLWLDWTGSTADPNDADLNAWLTKYQKVSALRFVDAAKASKVIGALRLMGARRATEAFTS